MTAEQRIDALVKTLRRQRIASGIKHGLYGPEGGVDE